MTELEGTRSAIDLLYVLFDRVTFGPGPHPESVAEEDEEAGFRELLILRHALRLGALVVTWSSDMRHMGARCGRALALLPKNEELFTEAGQRAVAESRGVIEAGTHRLKISPRDGTKPYRRLSPVSARCLAERERDATSKQKTK